MLMNFSPLGLMNKPTYQTLDEVEIAKQIESMEERENSQQFMQQPQQNTVQMYGRIVPAQECIAPNEVPMDGNTAFFPKQDLSEIYAKSWGADGKIYTRLYNPVLDADPNNLPSDTEKAKFDLSDEATAVFMKRFDELEQKIEQLKSSQSQRKTPQSQRKDDAE